MDISIVNGCLLRVGGTASGLTLLLLPGFADNGAMFAPLFRTALVNRFRLVAVDLPGFGATPRDASLNSLRDFGSYVARLAAAVAPGRPVGLVGHSVASVIACEACGIMGKAAAGLFSIEGNLTAADAYFSGKAAEHADAQAFKKAFLEEVWRMGETNPLLRRYHAAAEQADAEAMWHLGRDAKAMSGDEPGRRLLALRARKLYYWSPANTPGATQAWIAAHPGLPERRFANASHWPTVDCPHETAASIVSFFDAD